MDPQEIESLQATENQELEQSSQDVLDHTDAMETLHETMTGLEKVCASLEALQEPMTPQQAVFANHAFTASAVRIGVGVQLPPARIFTNRKVAQHATALSMETVGETLRTAWQAIVALLKRVRAAFSAFFTMIFQREEKVAEEASAQETAAKAAIGKLNVDANEIITMPAKGARLLVEGQLTSIDDGDIRAVTKQCEDHFDNLMESASLLFAVTDKLIDEASQNNGGQVSSQIAQGLGKAYDHVVNRSHRNGQIHEFHGDTLPGEARWVSKVEAIPDHLKADSNPLAIIQAYATAFRHYYGQIETPKHHGFSPEHQNKIRRITPEREAQICAVVKSTTQAMSSRRNRWEQCSKEFEAATRRFEQLASDPKSDAARMASMIRGLIQGVSHLLKGASTIMTYHLKTQSAYLALAQELSGREVVAPEPMKQAA